MLLASGKEPLDRESLEVKEWETRMDLCPGLQQKLTGGINLDHGMLTS